MVTADLDDAAAAYGLWYPPDPSSWRSCTIGGNVATNAGGLCCIRYGTTGGSVLGLTGVLADGRAVRTGRRTVKGVAGYDLTRLLVGSEGTLAVITEVTVRLRPRRPPRSTVVAIFDDLTRAGEAVGVVCGLPLATTVVELMDAVTLRAVESMTPMGLGQDAAAMLLVQVEHGFEAAAVEAACAQSGARETYASEDPVEADLLLEGRRLALPALQRLGPVLLDDVAVPRRALPEFIARTQQLGERTGLVIGTFGHAGDGNMHPTIVYDEKERDQAAGAFGEILDLALSLGGTITGEHGVGSLKRRWLSDELDPVALTSAAK